MASFTRYRNARSIQIANCHMFSTLHVGAYDVLVTFDDACPTSSDQVQSIGEITKCKKTVSHSNTRLDRPGVQPDKINC